MDHIRKPTTFAIPLNPFTFNGRTPQADPAQYHFVLFDFFLCGNVIGNPVADGHRYAPGRASWQWWEILSCRRPSAIYSASDCHRSMTDALNMTQWSGRVRQLNVALCSCSSWSTDHRWRRVDATWSSGDCWRPLLSTSSTSCNLISWLWRHDVQCCSTRRYPHHSV